MNRSYSGLAAALSLLCIFWLDPFQDEVGEGNKKFHDKRYDESERHYKNAERYAPNDAESKKLRFNQGAAAYMAQGFERAINQFEKAIGSGDRDVQKRSFFNMGNAYLKMGKYKEAVDSYISALKIDPSYESAKKNLEYLLKKKNKDKNKDQKDQKDQERHNKEKNKDNTKDNKSGKDKQDKEKQKLNKEQVKNLLNSMKNNPVRRRKGTGNGIRMLEKGW